ncbi:MAG: DUF5011 domain-containing protein [Alteromonadales bacterium]|nr:DUF5011 domain-containing protein [Alteromonadales bacterium]
MMITKKILSLTLIALLTACGGGSSQSSDSSSSTNFDSSTDLDNADDSESSTESDTESPVLTLNGESSITINLGNSYSELSATVTDNIDSDLEVEITGEVDTTTVGQYTLTYNATDSAGNVAAAVIRTVNVVDVTAPVITLNGDTSITINHGDAYSEPGATITDNVDADLVTTITGSVNTTTVGQYILTYNATDSAGNVAAAVIRTVNVVDVMAPVITLNGDTSITINHGDAYREPGAMVTDNVDADLVTTITGSVNTTTVGQYTLTYQATDSAGNAAIAVTRTVNVIDVTAPVITLNGDSSIAINHGDAYNEANATVTDNVDTSLVATISGTVDTSTIGSYELSYDVTDAAGNVATTLTRTVNVVLIAGTLNNYGIAGLTYTTASQSGITDSAGSFFYKSGESITFSLGDTIIGDTVLAKESMTVFDLVEGAELFSTYAQVKYVIDTLSSTSAKRLAFNKLNNILSFLQTLDSDTDPTNGINIQSGVGALFTDVQIDFEQNLFYFDTDKQLRIITHQASALGLLDSADIAVMGHALESYYQEHNIEHKMSYRISWSNDSNADGNPDTIYAHTYDEDGNQTSYSVDSDADGNPNRVLSYTFDSNSNQLTYTNDLDGDGALDKEEYASFDTNGNIIKEDKYVANNTLDSIEYYTYDIDGNKLTQSSDEDVDDSIDRLYTYTYDDRGNNLTITFDNGADGNADSISTYSFDENNNKLSYHDDWDANGLADAIYTYTWDADNNKLSYGYDSDGDGALNRETTYSYDANGNKLTYFQDNDMDGNPDKSYFYVYSDNGKWLTNSKDTTGDGNINKVSTYTYDANHNKSTYTYDSTGDGNANSIRTYSYDTNTNMLLVESYDSDADGTPDDITTYSYDSDGNMLTQSNDDNGDGIAESIYTTTQTKVTWVTVLKALY